MPIANRYYQSVCGTVLPDSLLPLVYELRVYVTVYDLEQSLNL